MIPLQRDFFFFLPYHMAYGILVPHSGIEPVPLAVKVQHLNHRTTRVFPQRDFLNDRIPSSLLM